ncbi:MAG: STAS/SEC14 domain-containing protein [Gemmatimonadetes bacterium]|nr:MAG: STAS/SEC14 domain-containing protein [Gemmatimonadota bacterium]
MIEERVYWRVYQGYHILYLDLSAYVELDFDYYVKQLRKASLIIREQPPKSVRVLTNLTKFKLTKEATEIAIQYTRDNTPYVKASAIVGASPLSRIFINTIQMTIRRKLYAFETEQEALDWLIRQ